MNNEIVTFINNFKFVYAKELEKVFTEGNCYYFAVILKERFRRAQIYYDTVMGHFVTKYHGRFYDITGDVTGKYHNLQKWNRLYLDDDLARSRIIRDCIYFKNRLSDNL